jgi:hypothetical protein
MVGRGEKNLGRLPAHAGEIIEFEEVLLVRVESVGLLRGLADRSTWV